MKPASDWVAGVDGCPAGWLVVLRRLADPACARAHLVRRFADVLELSEAPRIIAVDMPIGLPERSGIGGRRCDVDTLVHTSPPEAEPGRERPRNRP